MNKKEWASEDSVWGVAFLKIILLHEKPNRWHDRSYKWHERKRSNFAVSFFRHNGYFRLRKAQKRCGRWTQIIYIKQHFYTKYSKNRISKWFLWNRNIKQKPQGFYQPWGSYLALMVNFNTTEKAVHFSKRLVHSELFFFSSQDRTKKSFPF